MGVSGGIFRSIFLTQKQIHFPPSPSHHFPPSVIPLSFPNFPPFRSLFHSSFFFRSGSSQRQRGWGFTPGVKIFESGGAGDNWGHSRSDLSSISFPFHFPPFPLPPAISPQFFPFSHPPCSRNPDFYFPNLQSGRFFKVPSSSLWPTKISQLGSLGVSQISLELKGLFSCSIWKADSYCPSTPETWSLGWQPLGGAFHPSLNPCHYLQSSYHPLVVLSQQGPLPLII